MVRRAEVIVRRVSAESIEAAVGVEDGLGVLGYEKGDKATEATLVVDSFSLVDPSRTDLALLEDILHNQHGSLLLGDVSGLAGDFEALFDEGSFRHDQVFSDLSISVDGDKVKAVGILEGKIKAIETAGRQRERHVSGKAEEGNGLHGESFAGDPTAALGD